MASTDLVRDWAENVGPGPSGLRGDAASALIANLRPEAWTTGASEIRRSIAVRVPGAHASLVVVLSGSLFMWSSSAPDPVRIDAGGLALFTGSDDVIVAGAPAAPIVSLDEVLSRSQILRREEIRFGTGPLGARFLGAAIRFGIDAPTHLVRALPARVGRRREDQTEAGLSLIDLWQHASSAGNCALADTVAAAVCLDVFRDHYGRHSRSSIGAAMKDPHVGPLLALIHSEPSQDWSIDAMCVEAGLSRSALFARFRELTGQSPTVYVRDRRVQQAKRLLVGTDQNLSEVARAVGFRSSGSFCSAFKVCTGLTPGQFRSNQTNPGSAPPFPRFE